jgi:hypothetical protein
MSTMKNSFVVGGLTAAAFLLTPLIVGAATKGGIQPVKGAVETPKGSERGDGRSATYLKQKPPGRAEHKVSATAKHKPRTYGYSKGAKSQKASRHARATERQA